MINKLLNILASAIEIVFVFSIWLIVAFFLLTVVLSLIKG